MRIHLAALGAVSLLALAGGRSAGSRVHLQGIPLGDLVRTHSRSDATTPRPRIPTGATPTAPQLGGSGAGGTGMSGGPGTATAPSASPSGTAPGTGIGNSATPAGTGVNPPGSTAGTSTSTGTTIDVPS